MSDAVTAEAPSEPSFVLLLRRSLRRKYQHYLDESVPYIWSRWIGFIFLALMYALRVYYLQGFYIVTYGLGIFLLNLFIGFLTPLEDQEVGEGPILPTSDTDEFKPFIRRLPEFKFWYSCTKAFAIGFAMTFFRVFDIPVFWPILLMYFLILFVLTMKRQIKHMIKHQYLPFSFGKKRYVAKGKPAEDIRTK